MPLERVVGRHLLAQHHPSGRRRVGQLPVTNPHRFFAGYEVELIDEDAERLALDDQTPVDVYVVVRAAEVLEDFTANQKAPILVRGGRGWQIINQAEGCELRAPLFAGVEFESQPAREAC